jgi:BCD family chlorophyll transporter-like MFS transporter
VPTLGWLQIFRLGLVQTALGAIVVLCTSTMNRVMVVELALPATLPGLLVGAHYAVQLARPKFGYDSDVGGRRTPWIVGGIATLGVGAVLAALAIAWMATAKLAGIALGFVAYALVGAGIASAGTSLLAMLAARTPAGRQAPAASLVWLMMIMGFILTTALVGRRLDPFTFERLVWATAIVSASALALTIVALWGLEPSAVPAAPATTAPRAAPLPFREVFAEVWGDRDARAFTIFVFVSMLAYSTQDLILEPFAGAIFGLSPGATTRLSSTQHGGVFVGMLAVAVLAGGRGKPRFGSVRGFTIGGCVASALALLGIAASGFVGPSWPLVPSVFLLGLTNGAFAVAAIGWMMSLASAGRTSREGVRMGLWGGAQAMAFALGGFLGTAGVDAMRWVTDDPNLPYATVFAAEAIGFVASAWLARNLGGAPAAAPTPEPIPTGALSVSTP